MPSYYPPDIIDNDASTLADALTNAIRDGEQRRLDIATGYFAPAAWNLVGATFGDLAALRLLLGERPDVGFGGHETVELRRYYRKKIAGDLESLVFDREHVRLVDALVAFLARDEVQTRIFSGSFLHAKAYIFERLSFVGSSNFTPSGLIRNSELMLSSASEGIADQLRAWFENKWAESADFKDELIAALDESKFGSKPYSPFDVFIKALYEYFKDRIALEQEREPWVDLARFQEEGKAEAIRLLDKWGGVLVADAVGLGKTYIGLSLLEHELITKRRGRRAPRALVVCPAQLRDLVWEPRLRDYGIPSVDILSQEEIGREEFDWKRYLAYDVVLVDESHNFRNPATNRYLNLSKIVTGGKPKRVILMTATPVNNSLWDLYHQIRLLARSNDHHYRSAGIGNLKGYFGGVIDRGLEIFDLLELTTVRRSRADIRRRQDAGEQVIINNQPVRFPDRQLERIDYDLDGTYQGFYRELVSAIERLNLVAYNIAAFARVPSDANKQANQRNTALIALMKMLYLKRLESSAAAFEVSINRQASFQEAFLAQLRQGRLLDAASYRKVVAVEEDDEQADATSEILARLPAVEPSDYNLDRVADLVAADVATLRTMTQMVADVRERSQDHGDDKLQRIKDVLAGSLKGRKVLLFTSYHDTARYLAGRLRGDMAWLAAAGHPEIGVITGETRPQERKQLIERFSPLANRPADDRGGLVWRPNGSEIQILISTDVLSEGQNLQDAGVIVNYDLHWNPVRLIQRAGRVDRIGSRFETIQLYNVFPEDELEDLLGLVRRLIERIAGIDRSVGLDASVLGEAISERSLDQLRQLHANDQQLLRDLEAQAELISTEDMKFPLVSYIQQIGASAVADIPMGIHSAKRYRARDGKSGTFLAFVAGDRHFWRFYPDDGGDPETRIPPIYKMIECARDEARLATGAPPYDLIERATRDIVATLRGEQARTRTRPPMTGATQKLYNWLNVPTLWQGDAAPDPDVLTRLNAVLMSVSLRPYERDNALRQLIRAYETDASFAQLVTSLDAFFTDNSLYQAADTDVTTAEAIKEEDVRLVCFERLEAVGAS